MKGALEILLIVGVVLAVIGWIRILRAFDRGMIRDEVKKHGCTLLSKPQAVSLLFTGIRTRRYTVEYRDASGEDHKEDCVTNAVHGVSWIGAPPGAAEK